LTAIPQPEDPTDRALALEAIAYVNAWGTADETLSYLRNTQLGAALFLREGGEAARRGYLLSAAYAARSLTDISIRLAWVYAKRADGGDALRGRIQRLRALDAHELERTHKAIERSSKSAFIKNIEQLYELMAGYGAKPAPKAVEELAVDAEWREQYGTYRLLSAIIHSGPDGWVIAQRYEEQGGFLPLVRWTFSNTVAGMSNLYPLLQANPDAPKLVLNARSFKTGGKV
jgi:hypothetical protein